MLLSTDGFGAPDRGQPSELDETSGVSVVKVTRFKRGEIVLEETCVRVNSRDVRGRSKTNGNGPGHGRDRSVSRCFNDAPLLREPLAAVDQFGKRTAGLGVRIERGLAETTSRERVDRDVQQLCRRVDVDATRLDPGEAVFKDEVVRPRGVAKALVQRGDQVDERNSHAIDRDGNALLKRNLKKAANAVVRRVATSSRNGKAVANRLEN